MSQYISTSSQLGEQIDCRALCFQLSFHHLSLTQRNTLLLRLLQFYSEFLNDDEFYTVWKTHAYHSARYVKRKPAQISAAIENEDLHGFFSFFMDSYVRNPIINQSASRKSYIQKCRHPDYFYPKYFQSRNADYLAYFVPHFPPSLTLEELRAAVIQLFREEKRWYSSYCFMPDAQGLVISHLHHNEPALFCGRAFFQLHTFCMDGKTNKVAEQLASLLNELSVLVPNLSGLVAVLPDNFPPDRGTHSIYAHSFRESLDTPLYPYCTGCEWYQLVSSLQQQLLPALIPQREAYPSLLIQQQGNGAISVQIKKSILDVDVEDLRPVKQLLYPALLPGFHDYGVSFFKEDSFRSSFVCSWLPRSEWELYPIFPEEVQIVGDGIKYISNGVAISEGGIRIQHLSNCPTPGASLNNTGDKLFAKGVN